MYDVIGQPPLLYGSSKYEPTINLNPIKLKYAVGGDVPRFCVHAYCFMDVSPYAPLYDDSSLHFYVTIYHFMYYAFNCGHPLQLYRHKYY